MTAEFLQDTDTCFKVFDVKNDNIKDYRVAFTYDMVLRGLVGMMQYDDQTCKWL